MTAEEMFKKEGFGKSVFRNIRGTIIDYEKVIKEPFHKIISIIIDLQEKQVSFDSVEDGWAINTVLNKNVINALYKQIEELKQNGEW